MILTGILIVFVLAIAFFHYTQGFFSATLSAILAVTSAVLAFSYHETVVESFLGGRFASTAHAMTLAVLFAVLYFGLRFAFDKMIPGNLRFPVIVDKVGGAVMGLVAGVFVGGILAIVAQYLPLMPSLGGLSRYSTEGTRLVTLPPEVTGRRAYDSETWDSLKSEKPGVFEPEDKQGMVVPMDDLVVDTVDRLSDGGSLGWDRPLKAVHPDFLAELFGQRLGMQAKAARVATSGALASVELYRVDLLPRRDHEYKDVRQAPLDATPLKPKANEVLVVARVMFTRAAKDTGDLVRFSPGSVRLVAKKGSGADAEIVNYHPLGTVDKAQLLQANALDDFLFVDGRGADRGADLAFLVDKSAVQGGQGTPMKFSDGTFIEVKRMARQDLGGKTLKGPAEYKASENVLVLRKKQPKVETAEPEAAAPAPEAPSAGADLKSKLVGSWAGTSDAGQLVIEFKEDGSLTFNNTPAAGQGTPTIGQGTWAMAPDKTTADTLVINRTVNGNTSESTIKFTDDNNMTLTGAGQPPRPMTRR